MCQTCIGCGKCTGMPAPSLARGVCPLCRHENVVNALRCSACGNLLPAPPGRPILPVLPADQADRRR